MPFWKPPELPKSEKLPPKRADKGPKYGGRLLAAIAGVAFGMAALMGISKMLEASGGQGGSFRSLAMLIPTVVLLRYALTGKIKL
jgi:hypothetical protein